MMEPLRKAHAMKRKRFSTEQIVAAMKQHELGMPAAEIIRKLGIAEQTFYRWRHKFGGMEVSDAKRLKSLERENSELKKVVAELTLDNRMLKDVASKKW